MGQIQSADPNRANKSAEKSKFANYNKLRMEATRWQDTPGVSPAFMEEMLAWKQQMDHQLTAWAREMENLRLSFTSPALGLGPGQFSQSGKPASKPVKPSRMQLREAYMLTNRAIHAQRIKFFKLDPQEKRYNLVTVAKTLAELLNDKNRAHKRRPLKAPPANPRT